MKEKKEPSLKEAKQFVKNERKAQKDYDPFSDTKIKEIKNDEKDHEKYFKSLVKKEGK